MSSIAEQLLPSSVRAAHRPYATTSGLLLASAGAPLAIAGGELQSLTTAPTWQQASAAFAALLLVAAGLSISRHPSFGRTTATVAGFVSLGLAIPYLTTTPVVTLLVLVCGVWGLALLWGGKELFTGGRRRLRPLHDGRAQGSALAAFALWCTGISTGPEPALPVQLMAIYGLCLAAAFSLSWAVRERADQPRRALSLLVAAFIGAFCSVAFWGRWWWAASGLAAMAAASSLLVWRSEQSQLEGTRTWEPLLGHPERLFVATFASLSAGGTLLLALPQSASSQHSIGFLDAAFTSISAVCVTGLVVLDTARDFSAFGETIILVLIQLGGLGIMTFSTVALWALGRRMSLRHESAAASLLSTQDRGRLFGTARRILVLTFTAEATGAFLLTLAFAQRGDDFATATWRGTFTAVSAFCNAGFALQTDSLIPYQSQPLVLHIVATLIILGGLSPLTVLALPLLLKRTTPVSLQHKLSLSASVVLLVLGFLFILAFEWNDSLKALAPVDRLHNAWFQSATLRTAGFNSVDFMQVRPVTLSLMMLWMFVGGSPGGTAGGIKTTTLAVLFLSVVQSIRGQWHVEAFGRRISEQTRAKAAVVASLAAVSGIIALVAVQLTQQMPSRQALFEVVSALGTVGLSIGGTSQLDGIGKIVIMGCMFIGRVGPLSVLLFLRDRRAPLVLARPEEEIGVG